MRLLLFFMLLSLACSAQVDSSNYIQVLPDGTRLHHFTLTEQEAMNLGLQLQQGDDCSSLSADLDSALSANFLAARACDSALTVIQRDLLGRKAQVDTLAKYSGMLERQNHFEQTIKSEYKRRLVQRSWALGGSVVLNVLLLFAFVVK